jgi:hypothetical protein
MGDSEADTGRYGQLDEYDDGPDIPDGHVLCPRKTGRACRRCSCRQAATTTRRPS